jgi:diguanylate cyclase (GGDEF)-like protein
MNLLLRLLEGWPRGVSALARRQTPLFASVMVLIGFVLAGMAALDVYLYRFQLQQGERSARNLSHLLSDETDRSLRAALSGVSAVADRLRKQGIDSTAALDAAAQTFDLQAPPRGAAGDPRLDSLFIAGADGRIFAPGFGPADSVAELHGGDYLDHLRHAPPGAIYVSAPFSSTTEGTWQLSLVERVSASDGGFLGMVGGVFQLASFDALLGELALGAHESISIFRDDGVIIACFPQREIALGASLEDTDFHAKLLAKSFDGMARDDSAPDGVDRLFAIVHSPDFPVVSVVALDMNAVVADWRRQAEALAGGVAVIILAIALGAIRLAGHNEQLANARQREAVRAQVAIQYQRFNNAMDNITQGLAMYDRANRLIACNRRYAEIYGLPLALTRPGARRDEILAHRGHAGLGKAAIERRVEPDGSLLIINELGDGRVIAQRKKQLPEGGWVSTHEDITDRRRAEARIEEMATHDALTGLHNRFAFRQRLERQLIDVRRPTGRFAVLYLDLDHFKFVNDHLGHTAGDALLREAAKRILAAVRKHDAVARLGGDEFAILHRLGHFPGDGAHLAERLISAIGEPFSIDGDEVEVGVSIGISLAPDDAVDADELIRMADMALHHAKARRGRHEFFDASMDEKVRYRHDMEQDLRLALSERQFELYFQPVVGAADRRVKSFEALLRWNHPERGPVSPGEFVPLAEEIGLIVPIGEWVLREACREAARWPAHIKVAVNVSAAQFKSPDLLWSVSDAIAVAGLASSRLIVEVTESVMINDAEQAVATLHALRGKGIAIAMDDFGTGYSSLSYLRRFPFDKIKIDKTFIDEMGEREDGAAIVRAATGLAKAFGMESVAEGIETEEQLVRAAREGCSEAQGFLISRPMPAPAVFAFLGVEPSDAPSLEPASTAPRDADEWRAGLAVFPGVAAVSA